MRSGAPRCGGTHMLRFLFLAVGYLASHGFAASQGAVRPSAAVVNVPLISVVEGRGYLVDIEIGSFRPTARPFPLVHSHAPRNRDATSSVSRASRHAFM